MSKSKKYIGKIKVDFALETNTVENQILITGISNYLNFVRGE